MIVNCQKIVKTSEMEPIFSSKMILLMPGLKGGQLLKQQTTEYSPGLPGKKPP